MRLLLPALLAVGLSATLAAPVAAHTASAPGAPGSEAVFTSADKQGFGTARSDRSLMWFTLGRTGVDGGVRRVRHEASWIDVGLAVIVGDETAHHLSTFIGQTGVVRATDSWPPCC